MDIAHIISFLLDEFNDKTINNQEIVQYVTSSRYQLFYTSSWIDERRSDLDILRAWAPIDLETLVGSNNNFPANAIYMTKTEYVSLGHFKL